MTFPFKKTFFFLLSVFLLGVLFVNIFVLNTTQGSIKSEIDGLAPAQVVIILGAGVYGNGELSPIYKERVDTAVSIYRNGIVKKILVSGDNESVGYNEVVPVQEYLLARGIPAPDIFLDYAGFNTYNSMYRAREVFEVKSAVVVTQSFHLSRAIFLAQTLGIEAEGLAPPDDRGGLRNSLRELPARIKAVGNVLLETSPTYLGKRIPITGDGTETHSEYPK